MKKIVIIGAGLGGLTAGNLLCKKGHQVTIFESHFMPGGYTAGFRRKGFYFESGTDAFEMSSEVFKTMDEIGVLDKIRFRKLEPFMHLSETYKEFPSTYQNYKKMIYDAYPAEKKQLDSYFSSVDDVYKTMKRMFTDKSLLGKVLAGPKLGMYYLQYRKLSVKQFVGKYFSKDSSIYHALCNIVPYPDSSAINIGGAYWTVYHDYWTVADGMQSWADILADKFIKQGGILKLKSPVSEILTEGNRATGVKCNNGLFHADYVIAACDYKQTFLNLLGNGQIPVEFADKLRGAGVSPCYFAVYLGLKISNAELRNFMKSPHALIYEGTAPIDLVDSGNEDFFKNSRLSLYSPSLVNSDLAPQGKSSLMLATYAPYHWMNNWGNGDRTIYTKLKANVQETLINRTSLLIPDLPRTVDFQDSATPLTFERYTKNNDGATNSWGMDPERKFYRNSMMVYVKTPVRNLLVGSSWASQIGGVPFAIRAGKHCASLIK